ncbi:MAG: methionyl-tRNA formyltransferase [bacterium]|nr:methionyl-tRNA formyltransferase [bacterium]
MSKKTKIVYFGSSQFSAKVLEDIVLDEQLSIEAVFTQPDKPYGRKRILKAPPVKETALKFGISVNQPVSMKKLAPLYLLREINPDFGVVVAYGQILPQRILDTAKFSFLNGHASALPRWRGAAPMERCLIEGDHQTAMCIMDMTAGLDEGDVLLKENFSISPDWSIRELSEHMQQSCSKLLLEVLHKNSNFDANRVKQVSSGVTYAAKITRRDAYVNFGDSGSQIFNQWRALRDHYGLVFSWKNKKLIVWDMKWRPNNSNMQPGRIRIDANKSLIMELKGGQASLLEIQLEGKKRMPVKQFLAGAQLRDGDFIQAYEGEF